MVQAVDSTVRELAYEFLNQLRDMGTANMFGVTSDLQEEFGFDRPTARALLTDWMSNYDNLRQAIQRKEEDSDSVILMVDGDEDEDEDVPVVDEDELPERKY